MAINGIGEGFFKETPCNSKSKHTSERSFEKDLEESILENQKNEFDFVSEKKNISDEEKNRQLVEKHKARVDYAARIAAEQRFSSKEESTDSVSDIAVQECEAAQIDEDHNIYLKNCIDEGYVLRAAVYDEEEFVYVEKCTEEGDVAAYKVDLTKADRHSKDIVVQTAIEFYERDSGKKLAADNQKEWVHAMEKFSDYAKERIKNGPPQYAIGAMEISVEKWDKLIEQVDGAIDDIKHELEERIEKQKEKELEKTLNEDKEEKDLSLLAWKLVQDRDEIND